VPTIPTSITLLMVGMAEARLCPPYEKNSVLAFRHKQKREAPMAKKKVASRAAAQPAVKKKWSGHKTAAKSSARKTIKSKARGVSAAKAKPAKKARPKQRIAISHHREEDFKADGLRAYAHYRDLGIADATHGLAQAHVIRLIGPCNPAEVSKLHYHDVEFQMVYVLKGWVKTYMEGQGETLMKEGSAWTQPPRIKHLIMDYSDDVELLEVILPAEFKTVELAS
jgi:mannose-6-phosphate isomerase-like protein (cupin superfamily)